MSKIVISRKVKEKAKEPIKEVLKVLIDGKGWSIFDNKQNILQWSKHHSTQT